MRSWLAIAAALGVAAAVTFAGVQNGEAVGPIRVFALCAVLAFAVQWVVFVPSYLRQTEHFFDLTGSLTYIVAVLVALVASGEPDGRSLLLAGLVVLWAMRLGTFLFLRVRRAGTDPRFDDLKPHLGRFLMTWTLQGLWVLVTLAAALAAITARGSEPLGWVTGTGVLVWVAGLAVEAVADAQKQAFRADPANRDRFITTGLWAWSRHPNYLGEIVLWIGIAIIAAPALSGWQWVTMVSPVFVFVLLTRVSGIPLLEARANRRWGGDPEYREYRAKTPVLIPRPPR